MASTRTKSAYEINQTKDKIQIDFKEQADFAIIDISPKSIFISFTFEAKPYDEMVTLKLSDEINAKESKYTFKKDEDKLLHLDLAKMNDGDFKIVSEHKFIEKKNHPLADPRGYQVKKPENKNWDKIIATLDESDGEEQDANQALKKIYDGCDDDTRRAMEKSLYESNGTVLNMSWGEVGKSKVEPYKTKNDEELRKEFSSRHQERKLEKH